MIDALDNYQSATGRLPFTSVSFDQFIIPEDIAPGLRFPPPRFAARDARLSALDSIYEGDFTGLVTDPSLVSQPIGLGRRLVDVQSDLLLMSDPESGGYDLRNTAADAIRDMLAYGGALLLAVRTSEGPQISTVSPLTWYPLEDEGAVLVRPFTSVQAKTPQADRVMITFIDAGIVIEYVYEWKGMGGQLAGSMAAGEIGQPVSEESIGNGALLRSPRSPQMGIWGHSIFLDLAAPLLELSKRFTQNSLILDRNADPVPVFEVPMEDAVAMFPIEQDKTQPQSIVDGLTKLRQNEAVHLTQGQKVAYLEFSGQIDASFDQIMSTREIISNLSGLPAVLDGISQAPPSGVSLRLQYLPFYAATRKLQGDLTEVLEDALAEVGLPDTITWPHIFETLDAQSEPEPEEEPEDDDDDDSE